MRGASDSRAGDGPRRSVLRGAATNLPLAATGLIAGLVLAEIAARVAPNGAILCFNKSAGIWAPHPLFGWFHMPSKCGWAQACVSRWRHEWRAVSCINRFGLRDREHSYEKPPGTFRILILGDSFVEGAQVAMEKGVVARLQRRLVARRSAHLRYEVLNGAVAAWGTDNELLFFRHEGIRYAADLVLLAITPANDVGENVPRLGARRAPPKPTFTLEGGRLVLHDFPRRVPSTAGGWLIGIADALWRRTYVYPFALYLTGLPRWPSPRSAAARPPPRGGANQRNPAVPPYLGFALEPLTPEWAAAWELTKHLVRELRAEVEAAGARFAAAVVPSKLEVGGPRSTWRPIPRGLDARYEREGERVEAFLAAEGIPTCPLLGALRAHLAATGANGYFAWDIHWNAEGHAVVAAALEDCLERQGLLAPGR